ncbi:hypothetical protein IQ215_06010 [Cyanobacterium stanieri LEGE 03274]|uniref:Lipoprotein n=1 Tax=Cyanobacterium stanieri LEGE 03274 TaxID=1828756 RepID=A0ABR9V301_9CHRO|nr:hypothetical protein [Cyanobacterium stanieri]MBE9222248.1 hypothetical protein [Cyanobacterium stanieri LEGE 03274]
MKKTILILFVLSFTLVGCDRATLDGLNLRINADIRSDYDKQEETSENSNNNSESNNNPNINTSSPNNHNTSNVVNDPDGGIPFNPIANCSPSDITRRTNEEFYSSRGQVKSIDSKNQEEVNAWKEIYGRIETECQSN